MCGRTRSTGNAAHAAGVLGVPAGNVQDNGQFNPQHNACPGRYTPVALNNDDGHRSVRNMRWGLHPSYSKKGSKPNFFRMFNARSETIGSLSVFKRLVNRKRCVVPLDGFYEWKSDDKGEKQPYYIHKNDKPMFFAGLWDKWTDDEGEELYTYTLLTTNVSEKLKWLHHRMPVILESEDDIAAWLNVEGIPFEQLRSEHPTIFKPNNSTEFAWHAVDKKMNKISYNEPDACKAIDLEAIRAKEKEQAQKRSITRFFMPVKKATTPETKKAEETDRYGYPIKSTPDDDEVEEIEDDSNSGEGGGGGGGSGGGAEETVELEYPEVAPESNKAEPGKETEEPDKEEPKPEETSTTVGTTSSGSAAEAGEDTEEPEEPEEPKDKPAPRRRSRRIASGPDSGPNSPAKRSRRK